MKTTFAILLLSVKCVYAVGLVWDGLVWDASPTAGVTYTLYGDKSPDFVNLANCPIRQSCGTNLTTLINTDGTLWYFTVTAKNGVGEESAISNVISAGTNPPPSVIAPSNLRATSTSKRKAVLTWTASPSTSVIQNKVYQGSSPGVYNKSFVTLNTGSFTVTGLSSRKTYWFSVAAQSDSQESPKSNEVSCKIR